MLFVFPVNLNNRDRVERIWNPYQHELNRGSTGHLDLTLHQALHFPHVYDLLACCMS